MHQKTGKKVVVLIDEYDKPLISTLENIELHRQMRDGLKAFYEVLKSSDEHLKFVLLTGVTKFAQVSVFSALNHLQDISMSEKYATLCGITEEELHYTFAPELLEFAQKEELSLNDFKAEFRVWYNGYKFHQSGLGVYNPFSVINALASQELGNYWFSTATPSFLLGVLAQHPKPFYEFEGAVAKSSYLMELDAERLGMLPLLYQTGYLTIKGYSKITRAYTLGFPNNEVRDGFFTHLLSRFANLPMNRDSDYMVAMIESLYVGNTENSILALKGFFHSIPKELHLGYEAYYHSLFYTIFALMGTKIQVEVHNSGGRTDAVVQTPAGIFIFEFKYNHKNAQVAINQIKEKGYHLPYLNLSRPVTLIGVNFVEVVGVTDWAIEVLF